jgi:hypothetical protein
MNEPGAWVVTLAAADADIRIVIVFDEHESSRSIRPNLPVFFEALCPTRRIARRVLMAFADFENSYGREGYRERWRHVFPEDELASLKRWHESTAPADSRSAWSVSPPRRNLGSVAAVAILPGWTVDRLPGSA